MNMTPDLSDLVAQIDNVKALALTAPDYAIQFEPCKTFKETP